MEVDYKIKTELDGSTDGYVIWNLPAPKYVDFKNKKVLDLGCGAGGFLRYLQKQFQCKVLGMDPNQTNANQCREAGIEVAVGYAGEFVDQYAHQFEIVTCFEVLEHVYSHKDLFIPAHQFLKDNGSLVISTPNAFHVLRIWSMLFGDHRDLMMDPTRYYRPEHVRLYSYNMMKRAFKQTGFSGIKVYGVRRMFNKEIVLKSKILINYFAQHLVGEGKRKNER